ncbi:hypothetical protein [Bacillus piscicola]|uniref:hypothetical protein n=1 Tax=Bacillus piscicola TaxID=1632684 RepID=UPI001F09A932|nr:hypothetical protein [Bacillus piscicola]
MKAVCMDENAGAMLVKGQTYFVFWNGPDHLYVSHFNRKSAHCGCYKKELFQLVEKEEHTTIRNYPELDSEKVYKAKLVYRDDGYKSRQLKEYFLCPIKTHAYFYQDESLKQFCGCFPLHWFEEFEEIDPRFTQKEIKTQSEEEIVQETEQLTLF